MDQLEFLQTLGFIDNPFQFTNADEEEHLQAYFIPPPYFASVWGNPAKPTSNVIFAPRGGGKSAQRRMIEYKASESDVFAITYDRFEHLGGTGLDKLAMEYHLRNILRLALLGFLLEYHTRQLSAPAFSKSEREQIEALCRTYLGKINKLEAVNALNSLRTLSSKAKEFLKEWSGPLNALISAVLSSQGVTGTKLEPGQAIHDKWAETPSKLHLEIVRDLIYSIGFKSIYVLVDKIDETPETGNNAEASFMLIRPLMRDLELLQMSGVGFKIFLWDKLKDHYREFSRPDRIEHFELSWTRDEIDRMLSRRLGAFSNGNVTDLSSLTDAEMAQPLHFVVVLFAAGSPRDMIRVCQEILTEQLQLGAGEAKIGARAIINGIETFSRRRALELVHDAVFRELTKVGRLDFTTNYVANDVFKIEVNSARNKIKQWVQTGAVERVGELHTGGRPIHHYAVTDVRVAKAILPQTSLADFLMKKLWYCQKCARPMIRDWDIRPTQSCHACGRENTSPHTQA